MIPRAARPTDTEVECPHALWSRLRAESPLHEIGDAGYALVTRHATPWVVAGADAVRFTVTKNRRIAVSQ